MLQQQQECSQAALLSFPRQARDAMLSGQGQTGVHTWQQELGRHLVLLKACLLRPLQFAVSAAKASSQVLQLVTLGTLI